MFTNLMCINLTTDSLTKEYNSYFIALFGIARNQ